MSGIYQIENVFTGEVYIGRTSRNFERRWGAHVGGLKRGCSTNKGLQASWDTYGEGAFVFSIIEEMPGSSAFDLDARETYWVRLYRSQGRKVLNTNDLSAGKSHRGSRKLTKSLDEVLASGIWTPEQVEKLRALWVKYG